jgi:hypothetical protein
VILSGVSAYSARPSADWHRIELAPARAGPTEEGILTSTRSDDVSAEEANQRRRDLLVALSELVRSNCYNGHIQNYAHWGQWEGEGRWFTYPEVFENEKGQKVRPTDPLPRYALAFLLRGHCRFGANRLYLYKALDEVLNHLGRHHDLRISAHELTSRTQSERDEARRKRLRDVLRAVPLSGAVVAFIDEVQKYRYPSGEDAVAADAIARALEDARPAIAAALPADQYSDADLRAAAEDAWYDIHGRRIERKKLIADAIGGAKDEEPLFALKQLASQGPWLSRGASVAALATAVTQARPQLSELCAGDMPTDAEVEDALKEASWSLRFPRSSKP